MKFGQHFKIDSINNTHTTFYKVDNFNFIFKSQMYYETSKLHVIIVLHTTRRLRGLNLNVWETPTIP